MTTVALGGWAATGWPHPAAGEPADVRALGARFQSRADDLRALTVELTQGVAGLEGWQGEAAQRFRTAHQHLRHGLDGFVVEYERCVDGLRVYAGALDHLRHDADVLLPQVLDAQRRLANVHLDPHLPPDMAAARWTYEQGRARTDLATLRVRHGTIQGRHTLAVNACIGTLADSDGSTAIGRLFGDVHTVLDASKREFRDLDARVQKFIDENANAIFDVADVVGDASLIFDLAGRLPIPDKRYQAICLIGSIGFGWLAYQGHAIAQRHGAKGATKADIDQEWRDWKLGVEVEAVSRVTDSTMARGDPELVRLHKNLDRAGKVMTAKDAVESRDHITKYWLPRNPVQAGMYALGPGGAEGVAFWNAFEQGHQEDVKARGAAR